MKASIINEYGGPENLKYVENFPKPKISTSTEVLVEIYAAGVNPADWKMRYGNFALLNFNVGFPIILGRDFAGKIVEIGSGVKKFKIGDDVFGMTENPSMFGYKYGTYGEYCTIDESAIAKKPNNITFVEAASLPLVFLTAWQSLKILKLVDSNNKIEVTTTASKRILITGGSGGVGSIAVQLAKSCLGVQVVATTCSAVNAEFCTNLGADITVDYKNSKFDEVIKDYDAVFDTIGGEEYITRGINALNATGSFCTTSTINPNAKITYSFVISTMSGILKNKISSFFSSQQSHLVLVAPSGEELEILREFVERELVRAIVSKTFPLTEVSEAHRLSETGHVTGKIVISIKDEPIDSITEKK